MDATVVGPWPQRRLGIGVSAETRITRVFVSSDVFASSGRAEVEG